MKFSLARLAAALALSAAAFVTPLQAQEAPLDEARVEEMIRRFVDDNPEYILQAINRYVAGQQERERVEADEIVRQFGDDLARTDNAPVLGDPDAAVTIVYVLDAACGYCRQMTPVFKNIVEANPDVRIVHRWVPFLSPASEYAARVATVVWTRHQARYHEFYTVLMNERGPLTNEMVDAAVVSVIGADASGPIKEEVVIGSESEIVAATVLGNLELAQRAQIRGTPFIYVPDAGSGSIFRGAAPTDRIQAAVDAARTALEAR